MLRLVALQVRQLVQERYRGSRLAEEELQQKAQLLNQSARMLHRTGNSVEALPLFQQSLALRRRVHGEFSLEVAESLNNLAVVRGPTSTKRSVRGLWSESVRNQLQGGMQSQTRQCVCIASGAGLRRARRARGGRAALAKGDRHWRGPNE